MYYPGFQQPESMLTPKQKNAIASGLILALACFTAGQVFALDKRAQDPELIAKLGEVLTQKTEAIDPFDAQVWLLANDTRLARYVKDAPTRLRILQNVYAQAHNQALDPDLVLALMHVESFFDPYAISSVGAQGLMQVMPFWRKELGRNDQDNLTDIETNIRYGTTILAHYIERSEGDLVEALGRYNGSMGRMKYPELVFDRWRRFWQNRTMEEQPEISKTCSEYRLKACRR